MLKRVRDIAGRLENQTRVFRSDALAWQWEVNVKSSEELNAFFMPGGKIMVYSGLITQLDLADAELANVLGHEIAHALLKHVREQMSQAMVVQGAIGVGAAVFGLGDASADAAGMGYQAFQGGKPPEFLSSHPADASRAKQINELLPAVMPLYLAAI